jgi:hypothetical protein
MRALQKWVIIIWPAAVVTACAAVACLWVVRPVFSPIGLGRHDTTALIRHTFPIRLVQPQWITDQSNLYFVWSITEARARFLLVVALWAAACGTIIYIRARNSHRYQT